MEILSNIEICLGSQDDNSWRSGLYGSCHLRDLLTSLHTHLLSYAFFVEHHKQVSICNGLIKYRLSFGHLTEIVTNY